MNGHEFEHYVAEILTASGYHATVTKGSGDYGVDVLVDSNVAVQVKYYSEPVGLKAVQEIVAGAIMYDCSETWVVTNNTFTKAAVALAEKNKVRLIDGEELDWMLSNPDADNKSGADYVSEIRNAEFAEFLASINSHDWGADRDDVFHPCVFHINGASEAQIREYFPDLEIDEDYEYEYKYLVDIWTGVRDLEGNLI